MEIYINEASFSRVTVPYVRALTRMDTFYVFYGAVVTLRL